MKRLILIALIALPLYGQAPKDPDEAAITAVLTDATVTIKVAASSLAGRVADQTARAVKAEQSATTIQGQLSVALEQIIQLRAKNAELQAKVDAVPPPDKVVSWTSTAVPALYDFLLTMSAYPVASFWSPGTWLTPQGERHTQVCIVNGPVNPVMVVAGVGR